MLRDTVIHEKRLFIPHPIIPKEVSVRFTDIFKRKPLLFSIIH